MTELVFWEDAFELVGITSIVKADKSADYLCLHLSAGGKDIYVAGALKKQFVDCEAAKMHIDITTGVHLEIPGRKMHEPITSYDCLLRYCDRVVDGDFSKLEGRVLVGQEVREGEEPDFEGSFGPANWGFGEGKPIPDGVKRVFLRYCTEVR